MSDYLHVEADLPRRFGNINRKTIRQLRDRHLVEGYDWSLVGREVRLTDAALKKIAALLHLTVEETPAQKIAPPASAGGGATESLLVWRVNLPNQHIILCYRAGTDPGLASNLLRVRVRSSTNFLRYVNQKPMEVPVRHVQADLYELARACPRWKGRW